MLRIPSSLKFPGAAIFPSFACGDERSPVGYLSRCRSTCRNANGLWKLRVILSLWMASYGIVIAQQVQSDNPDSDPAPRQQVLLNGAEPLEHPPYAEQPVAGPTKNERRGSFLFAPIPISSPALGSGIVPVVGYLFPFSRTDKKSPTSVIGVAGLATDNGSRALTVGGELYFDENTYRAKLLYFQGNLNYSLYGIGRIAGDRNNMIPLKQAGQLFFGELLRQVGWRFFAGPRFITGNSLITVRPSSRPTIESPPNIGIHTSLRALGFRIEHDTRQNRFYPTAGTFLDLSADFFAHSLGSKYSFQSYRFTLNKYWTVVNRQVLAYNLFVCKTGGEPPFYGNCIYGTNNELRGYTAGRYLDRFMAGMQAEYRVELSKRFGLVGFGGIGEVVPGIDQLFRINNFLPAIGAGIRFKLSSKYHVNLRVDAAKGKDSHTVGIGIGEAF